MRENKPDPQQGLSPEEQLDILLEQFLNETDDTALETCDTEIVIPAFSLEELLGESDAIEASEDTQIPAEVLEDALQKGDLDAESTEEPEAEIPSVVILPEMPEEEADQEEEIPEEAADEKMMDEEMMEASHEEAEEDIDIDALLSSLVTFANDPAPAVETEDSESVDQPTEENTDSAEDATLEEASDSESTEQQEENPETQEERENTTQEDLDENQQADSKAESEEEPEEEKAEPPKKRRPRNTKAYGFFGIPHMLSTVVWFAIVVFIGVGLGTLVWNCVSDVLALGCKDSEVAITVDESDTLETLAAKLKKTGLIRYSSLFVIYGEISDAMESINPGSYTLNTRYDYHALVDAMSTNQKRITANVTIPEGFTCAQIFRLLEAKGITTVEKLEAAVTTADLGNYWFLEGIDRSNANCLEGFLFPDTYTFYLDHDATSVIQKFLDNFSKRFNDALRIKLDTLNMTLAEQMRANGLSEEYIEAHKMTARDVVIVASLIERETSSIPESYNIASVIYNRLTNPNEFPYLQIDAALIYYTGRNEITAEDLITDHPYNTYTRPGLSIAGPICNPGSYSLDAALDPASSEYYFYALDPSTGAHHFSATLKEHNDFLASLKKEEEE